jgi:sucrose phosphorylase
VKPFSSDEREKLLGHFTCLYGGRAEQCLERLRMILERYSGQIDPAGAREELWDQRDNILITYPDMVQNENSSPLQALGSFLKETVCGIIKTIHILPFFPSSSDEGFSVIDHRKVAPDLGTWRDIRETGKTFKLMMDIVINHVSRESGWAKDYAGGIQPALNYFIEMDPAADLSSVVRPRSSPLLSAMQTGNGLAYLWTTFSSDQLDLNFANPDVFFEFIDILLLYVSMGARFIRLDAIAYLWKKIGTSCIHQPETHEVVKLFRTILSLIAPGVVLLTETNVPHEENISYFGAGDEAHMVYQFTLPPLLLHTLLSGNAAYLTGWVQSLEPPPSHCTFFNFTASHDGIGVRPLEGILSENEIKNLADRVKKLGGHVSTMRNTDGSESPYELNITYFDALTDPGGETIEMSIDRYLCSQTIMLELKGIPAIYFNNLLLARNDYEGVKRSGFPRAINRKRWSSIELARLLCEGESLTARVFSAYSNLLRVRSEFPAFHPDATQEAVDFGNSIFSVRRIAPDRHGEILCVSNISGSSVDVTVDKTGPWKDLITGSVVGSDTGVLLLKPYQTCWLQTGEN